LTADEKTALLPVVKSMVLGGDKIVQNSDGGLSVTDSTGNVLATVDKSGNIVSNNSSAANAQTSDLHAYETGSQDVSKLVGKTSSDNTYFSLLQQAPEIDFTKSTGITKRGLFENPPNPGSIYKYKGVLYQVNQEDSFIQQDGTQGVYVTDLTTGANKKLIAGVGIQ
jgi:hypothetical protein